MDRKKNRIRARRATHNTIKKNATNRRGGGGGVLAGKMLTCVGYATCGLGRSRFV